MDRRQKNHKIDPAQERNTKTKMNKYEFKKSKSENIESTNGKAKEPQNISRSREKMKAKTNKYD
jgi:hypothetical protein